MPDRPPQLVVVDTETTGLDPTRDRVIDLGAVRLDEQLEVVDVFSSLVDPQCPVPLMIERMTGIGASELAGAPAFAGVYAAFREFAGDALLVGHNISFDLDMLAAEATRSRMTVPSREAFDTLEASLLLFPELERHNLREMAAHLGLPAQAHRAQPDAAQTAHLFVALCDRAVQLTAVERRLLHAAGWAPLALLDRFAAAASGDRDAPAKPPDADVDAADPTRPPPALDCDGDGWRAAFAAGGALPQGLSGFAVRDGQVELAGRIDRLLHSGGIALLEAGTGMGKSLAYLLPAAFFGAAGGARVVVSTKTKVLQRQLAERELPLVARCLPDGWRWSLLMGRENYLCRRRLDEAVGDALRGLPDRDRLLGLAYLTGRSRRGEVDLSSLPFRAARELAALPGLARELRSSAAACLGRRCAARSGCHWRLARSRAAQAHLVCVNHALLLTGADTLPAFADLVVDEAHLLPDEAVSAATDRVDRVGLTELVADARGGGGRRSLAAVVKAAARDADPTTAEALTDAVSALDTALREILPLADDLGAALTALLELGATDDDDERSSHDPAYARTLLVTPGLQEQPAFDGFATAGAALASALTTVARAGSLAADALPDDHRERPRAVTIAAEAETAAALLLELAGPPDGDLVCWAEILPPQEVAGRRRRRPARAGRPSAPLWTLSRAPLSPAPILRERLWERLRSAVLTSATLSVTGSFDYYRRQAGLSTDLDVAEAIFPSPFDYRRQAAVVLEHDPQTPYHRDRATPRQAARLRELVDVTGGRLLALFTNKRQLEEVAAEVGDHAEDGGVVLLAQGLHGGAAALADEFRNHPATVLLGVDALWTGQDFPGDALVCLVIAKLPFPRQDALFRARKRAAVHEGRDWFESFYLPETVLRFRQGFGRLIRTETDRGVVVVLDHRLTQKRYERRFLDSLPDLDVVRATPDELSRVVAERLAALDAIPGAARD